MKRTFCCLCLNFAAISPMGYMTQAGQEKLPPQAIPDWIKEESPETYRRYLGKAGLPAPWQKRPGPLGSSVAGIDRWQANHFLVWRKETADFLYGDYTPRRVNYRKGGLPLYERIMAQYTSDQKSDQDNAVALLTKALPALVRHPTIPPCGKSARADRNLEDEALLRSGTGWCNEQARVFVRLCQVAGIPARLVFLFYADNRSGHVVAEFYANGRWCMADASWLCVFPDAKGRLLSAAELHGSAEGKKHADRVYRARFAELLKLSDAELTGDGRRSAERLRQSLRRHMTAPDQLDTFGLLNYPLPR